MNGKGRVLVVDDEFTAVRVLSAIISDEGYSVLESFGADQAIDIIGKNEVDVVITDLRMQGKDGIQLFEYINEKHSDIPVIFLTAYGTVESAVQTMINGAFYYFIKPPDYNKLKAILARAVEQRCLKRELELLRKKIPDENNLNIIGHSDEMLKIFDTVKAVRDSTSSILISGKTGTGKELIARALHYSSIRGDKPFITVNCAAIPKELLESELFGYEKGAFTGATSRKIGRLEEAAGGTLFLDEIGEFDVSLQAKLLRVLEEKEINRLGSNIRIPIEFRLVSSTNRDLEKETLEGNFREDLLYRLNVISIRVPSLKERKDDIPLLVSHFINDFCMREKKKSLFVSRQAMKILQEYHWPGNIRQLRNVIERAVVLAKGDEITQNELFGELLDFKGHDKVRASSRTLKELEIQAVEETLLSCNGNKSMAAKTLGISRKTFYKRLRDVEVPQKTDLSGFQKY
jgi:DNA-binding NtrC family response regulator